MKWISEMPCSIVSAWNIFFEAFKERSDFYGMTFAENEIHPLPEIPCARAIGGMLSNARSLMIRLIQSSLNWKKFNTFMPLDGFGYHTRAKEENEVFAEWGIDQFAYFRARSSQYPPQLRHSVSDSIRAAAKVLNDMVRYPLPLFDSTCKAGLGLNSTLSARSRSKKIELQSDDYGNSGNLDLPNNIGGSYFQPVTPMDLAQRTSKDDCTGRSSFHHWVYRGSGKKLSRTYKHKLPVLQGVGKVRAKYDIRYEVYPYTILSEISLGTVETVIDFSTGRSPDNFDLSAADDVVKKALDHTGTYARVTLDISEKEVLLNEKNFQPLPYKYLE
ncbi:MAG: hypothetical protein E7050_09490 [Lentisphaerae bacterium]|nr:hypothetical protein [Lentisphaerota bacterium]